MIQMINMTLTHSWKRGMYFPANNSWP